jgi:hypothetical protein
MATAPPDHKAHGSAIRFPAQPILAPQMRIPRALIVVLLILNAIVLIGQVWPAGAPPFARAVNVATLIGNVIVFIVWLGRDRR